MPAKHLSSSYSIEVTPEQFMAIEVRDKAGSAIHVRWSGLSSLLEEALEFYKIQYNLNYGYTIFFHVLDEDQANVDFVEEIINQYAKNVSLSDILSYVDSKIGVKENCIARIVAENEYLVGLNESFD